MVGRKWGNNLRSVIGQGTLRSYFEPMEAVSIVMSAADAEKYPGHVSNEPPGAVGARYGSGCFHFSSKLSVSLIKSCADY